MLGLILIYLAASNIQPREVRLSEITSELIGRTVTTSGKIIYKSFHPAGHIFLTVSDGKGKLQVPLFAGFVNKLDDADDFKKGIKIEVTGLVEEYRGSLQVVPRKVGDIKILR
ncbi:MAG: OB-fold nucleic acid binding domain-containing protein [Candidatus Aenigmarchaeota archaeon]|nr:OB-fold nucleic acid binding domain-containing protein [Candidatus Aenigmarchaeota archaeon]